MVLNMNKGVYFGRNGEASYFVCIVFNGGCEYTPYKGAAARKSVYEKSGETMRYAVDKMKQDVSFMSTDDCIGSGLL